MIEWIAEVFNIWGDHRRVATTFLIALLLSVTANAVLWKRAKRSRFFYEAAMIAWIKQSGQGGQTPEQLQQLADVVHRSHPVQEKVPDIVDFGFVKDASGTWKNYR